MGVAIPVGIYGAAFGAAASTAGLNLAQTISLSLLLFSGATQFAIVGVIGSGGAVAAAIATGALLGIRNGFYAVRMAPLLNLRGLKRILAAHITIDESTAVALAHNSNQSGQSQSGQSQSGESQSGESQSGESGAGKNSDLVKGFWFTGLGVLLFWNLFTLIGALGAGALEDPAQWGLDTAVPAAFLALLWPQLTSKRLRIIALTSVFLSLLLAPYLTAGLPIIATVLIAIVAGWRVK
jgi:predicted branched-subunit amino acid permease